MQLSVKGYTQLQILKYEEYSNEIIKSDTDPQIRL